MSIKDNIFNEICSKISEIGPFYDVSLSIVADIGIEELRRILLELEREGKIKINWTEENDDERFPWCIVDCTLE